mmetsp:Transcript_26457/g.54592  ORF Transcript_26457/g.54592 Transcript_26457/m.54592 type:complete len:102 (-) Transcript_26457:173-478(-)
MNRFGLLVYMAVGVDGLVVAVVSIHQRESNRTPFRYHGRLLCGTANCNPLVHRLPSAQRKRTKNPERQDTQTNTSRWEGGSHRKVRKSRSASKERTITTKE